MVVFQSERIDFVPVSEALVDDYLLMMNDPEVQHMIAHAPRAYSREGELRWIRENLASGVPIFSMIERASGRFIGNLDLRDIRDGAATMGITLTPAMQDRGLGTEAIRRFVRYAFEDRGLDAVELNVYAHNPRAKHVYEKVGFRVTHVTEGEITDIHMRLEKAEFYKSSLA